MPTNLPFELSGKRIWVAGHRGMVGQAVVRRLERERCELLTVDRATLDLTRQAQTEDWLSETRPDVVILAAARVGGIAANDAFPAQFLYQNLAIQTNVMEASRRAGVGKLLFLGSSCIYPKFAPQPIPEEALLTGPLEPTNEWYAVAKIAGVKQVEAYRREYGCDFISAMPTNLYGPADNFDLEQSHVVPALLRKAHEARLAGEPELVVWGTGTPRRELLYVDDCADALVHLLKWYSSGEHINVGSGEELTIAELAEAVAEATGFKGRIVFDASRPDGTPRKLMDSSKLFGLSWRPRTPLRIGLRETYDSFLDQVS